jgi:hypothetical protein
VSRGVSIWVRTDKDRDYYSRRVVRVEASRRAALSLSVVAVLSCGHHIAGSAVGRHRNVPKTLFCPACYDASHAAEITPGSPTLPDTTRKGNQ